VHIALIRELHVRIGCSVRDAVSLAAALLAAADGSFASGRYLILNLERERFERDLYRQLVEAMESAPRPRRGRPRQRVRTQNPGE